jgi:hypothetical protein
LHFSQYQAFSLWEHLVFAGNGNGNTRNKFVREMHSMHPIRYYDRRAQLRRHPGVVEKKPAADHDYDIGVE